MVNQEFIIGKWYCGNEGYFVKFLEKRNGAHYFSEKKFPGEKYVCKIDWCRIGFLKREATQEELRSFLPKGHPDLITSNEIMLW